MEGVRWWRWEGCEVVEMGKVALSEVVYGGRVRGVFRTDKQMLKTKGINTSTTKYIITAHRASMYVHPCRSSTSQHTS